MHRPGFGAVDFHGRIGHHALEHDEDSLAGPAGGNIKRMAVVATDGCVGLVLEAVTEFSKTLQFPA